VASQSAVERANSSYARAGLGHKGRHRACQESGPDRGQGHTVYGLLSDDHEPRAELLRDFLLWYSEQPDLPKEAIKTAQKYLTAIMQMDRSQRGLPKLAVGAANQWMVVQVAAKQTRIDHGVTNIVLGKRTARRADHLPSFDDMVRMMHLALAGDDRVHPTPLAGLQTGLEVRITHATGVRGELVRSAKFEHLWPRRHAELAGNQGLTSLVM
jgi:hypothetical protein